LKSGGRRGRTAESLLVYEFRISMCVYDSPTSLDEQRVRESDPNGLSFLLLIYNVCVCVCVRFTVMNDRQTSSRKRSHRDAVNESRLREGERVHIIILLSSSHAHMNKIGYVVVVVVAR